MKKLLAMLVALALLAALALAGCGGDEDNKVTLDEVKKQAKEAVDAAVTYSKQKQEELMAKAKVQYQDLSQQSAELMAKAKQKAAQGSAQVQAQAQAALDDLQKQQAVVQEKMRALKESSGQAWEKAKVELEEALQNLKEAYAKAKAELAGE